MCEPTTIAIAMAAGSAMQAYGQYNAGKNEAKMIKATAQNNANIAEYNAKVADVNAGYEDEAGRQKLNQGAEERADIREQNRRVNSNLIAKAAGGGIDISGSVVDLLDQNITTGELNAYTVLNNAERDAYGNKVRAQNFRTEAVNTRFQSEVALNNANYQAKTVKNNALWQAAGTLVTGATKAASMGASGGASAGGSKMSVGDSYTRSTSNGGSVSVKRIY